MKDDFFMIAIYVIAMACGLMAIIIFGTEYINRKFGDNDKG